jgi:hypothetical protein
MTSKNADKSKMSIRELLAHLCEHGDDAFQSGRLSLHAGIKNFFEAWSAARKREIIDLNAARGSRLMDHIVLGDEWDLSLWRVPTAKDLMPLGYGYYAAINSGQHDPTDILPQLVKYPGSKVGYPPISDVYTVLADWVDSYGKIAVCSASAPRIGAYKKLLARKFALSPLDPLAPDIGFYVDKL